MIKMAPAPGSNNKVKSSYSKITASKAESRNTRSRTTRSAGSSADLDLKTDAMMDGNTSGAKDSVEPWFEDKLPGDGKAENSFSVLYNSTSSWESELESSKNKSWFDLVEEDEADIKNQSLVQEHRSVVIDTSDKPTIKIKEEVISESEDEDCCEAVTSLVPVQTDKPVVVKQEKDIDNAKENEKCKQEEKNIKQEKSLDKVPLKQEKPLNNMPLKQEKPLDNIPLKRERNSSNIGRVDSHYQEGKRIKQELDEEQNEVQLAKLNKIDCTDDKFSQSTDKYKYPQMKIKYESSEKELHHKNGSDVSRPNRNLKRTLDNSTETRDLNAQVKRERSTSSTSSSNNSVRTKKEYENDPEVLARRQKQIDYGKNTLGYDRYRQQIPREMRTVRHPRTPPKHLKYSRRGWDGMVKIWRQQLHGWDPASENRRNLLDSMSDVSTELGSITSDDTTSDCPLDEHTKMSTSTPSGSVDNINIGTGDYLDLDIEEFGEVIA